MTKHRCESNPRPSSRRRTSAAADNPGPMDSRPSLAARTRAMSAYGQSPFPVVCLLLSGSASSLRCTEMCYRSAISSAHKFKLHTRVGGVPTFAPPLPLERRTKKAWQVSAAHWQGTEHGVPRGICASLSEGRRCARAASMSCTTRRLSVLFANRKRSASKHPARHHTLMAHGVHSHRVARQKDSIVLEAKLAREVHTNPSKSAPERKYNGRDATLTAG